MRAITVVALALAAGACGDAKPNPNEIAPPPGPPRVAEVAADAQLVDPAPAVPVAVPVSDPPPVAAPLPGYDFISDVQVLYRVVACGNPDAPLPELLTHGDAARAAKLQKVVDAHCKSLAPYMDKFRTDYFGTARAWLVAHQPKDLPSTVVYPFGGGDVISTLYAFPDATEITTLSLELAGDPRKIQALSPEELDRDLLAFRRDIGPLINVGTNSSVNLSDQQRNAIAAQLSSHLLGLSTGGYEPVSVRFFTLDDAGAIHYVEKAELDAQIKDGKPVRTNVKAPAFAQLFGNVEVQYRKAGETQIRVHRHIGWSLANEDLKKHPGALAYLEARGKVAVCVKGAVYLLWQDDFSTTRKYILDHLAWMVSDSTGVPPNYAGPAGMEQEVFGQFTSPIIDGVVGSRSDTASRKLWAATKEKMPFRFGYVDRSNHNHLMITKPKSP